MNATRILLAVSLVAALSAPVLAGEGAGGFYLGARAVGSVANMDSVSTSGFAGTSGAIGDSDEVAGLGAVFGYSWGAVPLRTEVEAGYRFRFDLDARDNVPGSTVDYESNVSTTSILVNAAFEWRNGSDFTPFIGGTLGWARNSADTTRFNLGTSARQTKDNDVDNLAWGGMIGVDWDFADHWAAGAAYRYINLGEVDTGRFTGGDSVSSDDYVSHDVLLSFYYRF